VVFLLQTEDGDDADVDDLGINVDDFDLEPMEAQFSGYRSKVIVSWTHRSRTAVRDALKRPRHKQMKRVATHRAPIMKAIVIHYGRQI
jgi:hypothetical protein